MSATRLVLCVVCGIAGATAVIAILLNKTYDESGAAGRASVADIICISGGVPILRANAATNVVEHDNGRLSWVDGQAAYSTNAECVVRRQSP